MKRLPLLLALPVTLALLSGCIIQTGNTTPRVVVTKPRLTPEQGLQKLNDSGKVQVVFKGLATLESYRVNATTADIDSVTMRLVTANGVYGQVKQLSRDELSAPSVAVAFDGVPAGNVTLEVTAVDRNGSAIGKGQQTALVRARQTSIMNLVVALSGGSQVLPGTSAPPSTGSVQANITFSETTYSVESLTGEWVVSLGAEPPAGPVIGCTDERHWYIFHEGEKVNGYTSGYNDATHPTQPNLYFTELVTGTYKNGKLKLRGDVTYYDASGAKVGAVERVKYDVDYNPQTHHVVGVRNDQPGWAAPFLYEEGCEWEPGYPNGTGSPRPRVSPRPSPIVIPTPTPMATPVMTPNPTPTPRPSAAPSAQPTPEPTPNFDVQYPTRKFPPGQAKQIVKYIFSLYDHNGDGLLNFSTQPDAEGVVLDESQRQEGVDGLSRGSGKKEDNVTYVTTYGIAHLLRPADQSRDLKISEAELESFISQFSPESGKPSAARFFDTYPEVVLYITRF
jgi:hypothetical protein